MTVRNPDGWAVNEYVVETVEPYNDGGFSVTGESGWTFGVTKEEADAVGVLPVPGEEIVLLGGFGHQIRGIFIGGREYRYKTRDEAENEHQAWLADYDRRKEDDYQANVQNWLKRTEALDGPFRARMNRFAEKGKEFWKESGAYELFTVEQANALLKQAQYKADDPVVWLDWFYGLSYSAQKEEFPGLDDGHSGNTFGGMVGLAKAVAEGREI